MPNCFSLFKSQPVPGSQIRWLRRQKKQAQIGATKDTSASMSYCFSQPLFLQKPEICLCNPTELYLQEEKQNILSVLNLLHHIPQVFSESYWIFGMVRRKLLSRHCLRMSNFDRKRSRFKLKFQQQEHHKQYNFFMPSCNRVNVVSPVKADSHITTQFFWIFRGNPRLVNVNPPLKTPFK